LDISATSRIAPFGDGAIPVIARMTNTFIERIDNRTVRGSYTPSATLILTTI
jgi:hypothetical protein